MNNLTQVVTKPVGKQRYILYTVYCCSITMSLTFTAVVLIRSTQYRAQRVDLLI